MKFTEEDRKQGMMTLGVILGIIFLAAVFISIHAAWTNDMNGKRWALFAMSLVMGLICLGLATECFKSAKEGSDSGSDAVS